MTNPKPSEKLLDRFIAGECSPAERNQVESWIREDPARAKRFEQLHSLLVAHNDRRDWNVDKAYSTVQSRINVWNRKIDITPLHRVFVAPWARWEAVAIAAVALIAIAGTLTLSTSRKDRTVSSVQWTRTGAGETREVRLTDGSLIKLGPMTTLRHASNAGEVNVELRGLAGFEVIHDPKRTFRVYAGAAEVVDIGTSFVVRAYPSDSAATVVVTSGKIALGRRARSVSGQANVSPVELNPGEGGMVLASGAIVTGHAVGNEISQHLAQLGGRLSFENLDMRSVAADLGNWFGVKVVIADSALGNRRITAMFNKPDLSEILDAVAETTGSRYERKDGVITFASGPVR